MRHWDLNPGERVTLERSDGYSVHAVFRFRTTLLAYFERGDDLLEFELQPDGALRHSKLGRVEIAGADRNTRTVIEAGGVGEGRHFTRVNPKSLRR